MAEEDGTVVLAVGGKPGEALRGVDVGGVLPRRGGLRGRRGEYAAAEAVLREGLEAHPGDGDILYEIARVYALVRTARRGDRAARGGASPLRRACAGGRPEDEDLASLRDRPDWPL